MEKETALKILRERHDNALFSERKALETLIPELKESEDERIRKELLDYLEERTVVESLTDTRVKKDWIAWLEKQGEQKETQGIEQPLHISNAYNWHLWSIEEAKDGDILASGGVVFIFKTIHGVKLYCHCSAFKDGSFFADSYDLLTEKYFGEVYPATKEQRYLLFQKMKEAGYEWDVEKKELNKIEQ